MTISCILIDSPAEGGLAQRQVSLQILLTGLQRGGAGSLVVSGSERGTILADLAVSKILQRIKAQVSHHVVAIGNSGSHSGSKSNCPARVTNLFRQLVTPNCHDITSTVVVTIDSVRKGQSTSNGVLDILGSRTNRLLSNICAIKIEDIAFNIPVGVLTSLT